MNNKRPGFVVYSSLFLCAHEAESIKRLLTTYQYAPFSLKNIIQCHQFSLLTKLLYINVENINKAQHCVAYDNDLSC